VRSKEK
jgi:hypothetical protein